MKSSHISIPDSPYQPLFAGIQPHVESLFYISDNLDDLLRRPRVAIVGSRKISAYGKAVTARFSAALAEQGVVIVSGLAYGVDAVAHRAALEAGGLTIAVLPSSVSKIYPSAHSGLARQIIEGGGAILSEYPDGTPTMKHNFIGRNRIVSGISDALLITEAAVNSGSMHTARFALEQGKEVLAVPGNITSITSGGTNNLIKAGATPVTEIQDIFDVLGLDIRTTRSRAPASNHSEQIILDLLEADITDGNELLTRSELTVNDFNTTVSMMEITGKVRSLGANQWSIR